MKKLLAYALLFVFAGGNFVFVSLSAGRDNSVQDRLRLLAPAPVIPASEEQDQITDQDIDKGLGKDSSEIDKHRAAMQAEEATVNNIRDPNAKKAIQDLRKGLHMMFEKMGNMIEYAGHMRHGRRNHDDHDHDEDRHGDRDRQGHDFDRDSRDHWNHRGQRSTSTNTSGQ